MDTDVQAIQTSASNLQSKLDSLNSQIAFLQGVKVFDGLELTPWLLAQGTAANTNSTGNTAVATQGQPSTNFAFFGTAPTGPYADLYWYKQLGADPTRTGFKYDFSFMFSRAADAAASQAVELDIQQVVSNVVFNMGLQFDFAENAMRVWNRSGKAWIATPLPCARWTPGQWMRCTLETHRESGNVFYDALTINGTKTSLAVSFPATNEVKTDMLNCAVQLDGNSLGTAYRLYVDRMKFTAS